MVNDMYEEILRKHKQNADLIYDYNKRLISGKNRPMQIAICGKFKSGKTSLINLLLGLDLPVRAVTATKLVTQIKKETGFYKEFRNGAKIKISVEERNRLILNETELDDNQLNRIIVGCSSPLLGEHGSIEFWDTPGLEDTAELTKITMKALEQCDLAILVFDANKFGSWYEKVTLEKLQEILGGNMVFVINRIDLLHSEGDFGYVAKSAKHLLGDYGNPQIGYGNILYTSASPIKPDINSLCNFAATLANDPEKRQILCDLAAKSHLKCMLKDSIEVLKADINTVRQELDAEIAAGSQTKNSIYKAIDAKNKEVSEGIERLRLKCLAELENMENWSCSLRNIEKNTASYRCFNVQAEIALRSGLMLFHETQQNEMSKLLKQKMGITRARPLKDLEVDDLFEKMEYPVFKESSSGAITGGIAGAAAGAVLPVIGTVAGGVIGFLAGIYRDVNQDSRLLDEFEKTGFNSTISNFKNTVLIDVKRQYSNNFRLLEKRLKTEMEKQKKEAEQNSSSDRVKQIQAVLKELKHTHLVFAQQLIRGHE